jgi:hypothetical protein
LQSIILGDVSVKEGLDDAIQQTHDMLADLGYYD